GMADDHFVSIDHAETSSFDVLFLAEGEQYIQELFIRLQHFHELHNAAVRDIEFTVEAIGSWIALDADLADGGEVDASYQLTDILAFRVGRRESAHPHAVLFTKHQPFYRHIFNMPLELSIHQIAAVGAQVSFNVDAEFLFNIGA